MLLVKDEEGRTVFHLAAEPDKLDILHVMLKWPKNKLIS